MAGDDPSRLLFHCQHALGLGHLVRSLALAEGLAEHFDVVLLNGGRIPAGTRVPDGVELRNLPPLGYDAGFGLVSHDPELTVDEAKARRRSLVLAALEEVDPRIVLVELFPFGRNKFRFELEPLLRAVAATGSSRPHVVCSVRDILVAHRDDQAAHDERAAVAANAWFDAVLVHADPAFARLEESFRPATPLRIPVHHTGFVVPGPAFSPPAPGPRRARVLVSSGGGMVGEPLVRAAVAAHRQVADELGLTTTVVAGPFLPGAVWAWLGDQATRSSTLEAVRQVDDLAGEIARSAVSVSQCGYNTAMDLLRARTPAVVVPFADGGEDEQRRRAERLAALGTVRHLRSEILDGRRLAAEVAAALRQPPSVTGLDLSGTETSARLVADLACQAVAR